MPATSEGRRRRFRPSTVALHMLCGLRVPRHFVSTFWMPATSSTARTPAPAITPVPGLAGLSMTSPAPNLPTIRWGTEPPFVTGTWNMLFFADSPALRIASATSFALPSPTPTRPFWSPSATIALNENRRPPFTTLAQRFTWITRSWNSLFGWSDSRGGRRSRWGAAMPLLLEVQAAGACAVGERLDAPVVEVAATIERHGGDALLLRALGEQLADGRARADLALALDQRLHVVAARGLRQRDALHVVDDLGVDVHAAAEHAEPWARRGALDAVPDPVAADLPPLGLVVMSARHYADPAAFPAFRRMYSPSYLTPLPLYGSGGRKPRMSAATCPTSALSAPLTVRRVGFSTLIVMPSGGRKWMGCEKPSWSTSFFPSIAARYPVPTISSVLLNPVVTPCTMFAMCARMVPNAGLRVSSSALTLTSAPSTVTDVPVSTRCLSSAFAPFTRTTPSATVTVTPAGIGTGFLPTRDMRSPSLTRPGR